MKRLAPTTSLRRSPFLAPSLCAAAVTGLLGAVACSSAGRDAPSTRASTPNAPASPIAASWAPATPWARPERLAGRPDANDPIQLDVHLPLRDLAGARAELALVSDPASPRYAQYLTQRELEAKYLPTAADVAVVRAHFESRGLRATRVAENRAYVRFEGTVAQAERAFATRLGEYRVTARDGDEIRRAPIDPPSLPADVASRVSAVLGLSTPARMTPRRPLRASSRTGSVNTEGGPCSAWYGQSLDTQDAAFAPGYPSPLPWATCGYVPAQVRRAYGFERAVKRGLTGKGETIGLLEAWNGDTLLADAQTYAASHDPDFPLATSQVHVVDAPATPQPDPDPAYGEEASLDLEAMHAMAPGADVVIEQMNGADDEHFLAALNDFVTNERASLISSSLAPSSEGLSGPFGLIAPYESVIVQGALKGIGFYFASGDSGDMVEVGYAVLGPDVGTLLPAVSFPETLPEVTAVGGTSLALGRHGQRLWETGWEAASSFFVPAGEQGTWPFTPLAGGSEDAGSPTGPSSWWPSAPGGFEFGSGGGMSTLYAQPAFQAGIVPPSMATNAGTLERVIPDVAILGDPATGFLWGTSATGAYAERPIGGTSLSSPLFAGVVALAQQYAHRRFGSANPLFYRASRRGAFRDVAPLAGQAVGLNPGELKTFDYHGPENSIGTAVGYDDATGLGVPNGEEFLEALR